MLLVRGRHASAAKDNKSMQISMAFRVFFLGFCIITISHPTLCIKDLNQRNRDIPLAKYSTNRTISQFHASVVFFVGKLIQSNL